MPVIDPRDYIEKSNEDVGQWRNWLRRRLYELRGTRSDLSGQPIISGFEVHEGLYPRRVVPKSISWNWMLFCSVNCFLLMPDEHRPQPPSRTECYWLSVALHSKDVVDEWVDSLPFKVPPDKPWRGSNGTEVVERIRLRCQVDPVWNHRMNHPRVLVELAK